MALSTIFAPVPAPAPAASPPTPKPSEAGYWFSADEYLAFERASPLKHEYENGLLIPMSGASFDHNRITDDLLTFLNIALRGTAFEVVGSNLRVQLSQGDRYVYPDVVVVPDPPELLAGAELDTVLNPVLVVEVLSPSTRDRDRGTKFLHYRALPTLRHYLMLDSLRLHAELYTRTEPRGSQWTMDETTDPEAVLDLSQIGVRLPLREVYRRVAFDAGQSA